MCPHQTAQRGGFAARMSTLSATTTYTYAETGYANPHAPTSIGGVTHAYDNNGNVTAIGSLDYTWDWRNRLASAESSGGGITSYGYDHTGQRVPGDGHGDYELSEQVLHRDSPDGRLLRFDHAPLRRLRQASEDSNQPRKPHRPAS